MEKTGTIDAVWPFVENLPFGLNFLTLPEVIPKPPVSWSAVTTSNVFGFSSTNFNATPIALSNSILLLDKAVSKTIQ